MLTTRLSGGKYARFVATALLDTEVSGTMNASVSLANDTSFTFWYFMHGTRIGTLALLVNNETEWEKSGRQGAPAWYQANVILPAGEDIQVGGECCAHLAEPIVSIFVNS